MLQPFGWPTPPLLSGSWHEIDPDLAREFRDLLVSSQIRCTPLVYAGAMRRYRVRPLAFWPGWMWVDALVDTKQGAASAAFLYGPYGAHELDGTSALIHDVNEGGALDVSTADLAADYLRFFCSAVRGDEGPFFLIEDSERFALLSGSAFPDAGLAAHARPVAVRQTATGWDLEAFVYYGDALFASRFSLDATGLVEMIDDEPLFTGVATPQIDYDGLVSRPRTAGGMA
ncbi:hypothetical protein [Sphingopyxis panaciterrulae]|uniref:Uncharacterized protein n=1 Tax=Sphingopyxis panaciterrulae TaxID=462372 RepID=A0A7W9ESF3_9SPHN|nr:hypothetical protein [Sphingopyxis panaciterrulae]MBB5708672.1 hypothetical protein [Sphingopyxis panaciterrulae]